MRHAVECLATDLSMHELADHRKKVVQRQGQGIAKFYSNRFLTHILVVCGRRAVRF
jgi:hypothetical protein